MRRRTFSAEFKAKIVLEVLKGEKEISVIASENEIAPNQLRNWKNEFIVNAAYIFDNKKDEKLHSSLDYQTPAENYYPVLLGMVA